MAEGIRDKVAIVGFNAIRSGELWDKSYEDMLLEASDGAFKEAGLEVKDIQAAWLGLFYGGTGATLSRALKTGYIPVTKVENACGTGADVLRNACIAVASGLYDIVMAAGCEKMKDEGGTGVPQTGGLKGTNLGAGGSTAGSAALYATAYMHKYGYSYEEFKAALGHIAVKNHLNGTKNPKAHFQKAITMQQYNESPMMGWPLNLYDCCANVDGAAAAIVTTPEIARQLKTNYALVKGIGSTTTDGWIDLARGHDYASTPCNSNAARIAYEMAGVKDPVKEISEFNVHDAFTIVELLCYESFGLCPPGQAPKYIEAGFFDAEGPMPVNTDGGLKCFGHPVGVTGLKSVYEPYLQVTGQAGPRQLRNVKLAAGHAQGGTSASSSLVTILGARD